ncbi:gag-pol polyprotein [Lasius niger]|uniref:Gag-pol polyprotein n=1 Tax=Lasius niger TaxID=67767 RepID=A0A0J7KIU5_LASNI|nr:gag-pol polyprotein [Lasius niger]
MSLEDNAPYEYQGNVHRAVRAVSFYVEELFSTANKLELARNYMAAKLNWQKEQMRALCSELRMLRPSPGNYEYAIRDHAWNVPDVSVLTGSALSLSLQLISSDYLNRSPSVIRGDDGSSAGSRSSDKQLLRIGTTSPNDEVQVNRIRDDTLIEEIFRVEDAIDRISSEIASKTASLLELDVAAETALADFVSLKEPEDSWQNSNRVGRARRRGEASRPRAGSSRTSDHTNINMMESKNHDNSLPPQGIRTPSGRREGSTVPGAPSSLSRVGPAPSLPTGEEREGATVESEEPRNPDDDGLEADANLTLCEKPRAKRKARTTSPGLITPSDEENGGNEEPRKVTAVSLRKPRSNKKRAPSMDFVNLTVAPDAASSSRMSTETELSSEREPLGKKKTQKKKTTSKSQSKKNKSTASVSSSEVSDEDYVPQDMRTLGATAVGTIGINSVRYIEKKRRRSKNLNGVVSNRMRVRLERVTEVINTLMYKAEVRGDPAQLINKNQQLEIQVDKLKRDDAIMRKEMNEMRLVVEDLKKEISGLKDELNHAEEERRKAKESQGIAQSKLREIKYDTRKDRADKGTISDERDLHQKTIVMDLPDNPSVSRPTAIQVGSATGGHWSFPPNTTPVKKRSNENSNEVENIKKDYEVGNLNKQIKNLIRKRVELRRKGTEDSGTGSDFQRDGEKPLPQRTPRTKPRITANVQIVPPKAGNESGKKNKVEGRKSIPTEASGDGSGTKKDGWIKIPRRNEGRNKQGVRGQKGDLSTSIKLKNKETSINRNQKDGKPAIATRKPPRTAAVMITGLKEEFSYAAALKKARESIELDKLEIERTKIRRAANGSLLIEVLGPNGSSKASALEEKLREVLKEEAKVSRPVVKGEIRLVGLDISTSTGDVVDTIVKHGGCLKDDIKVGTIRSMNNGLFTVWVQCPLGVAIKMAKMGKIMIGWTVARVDLLDSRPTQCYKCWRFGHLRNACQSKDDFGGLCFRCGDSGHSARFCNAPPKCKICLLDGRAFDHRLGSNFCPAVQNPVKVRSASAVSRPAVVDSARGAETMEIGDGC